MNMEHILHSLSCQLQVKIGVPANGFGTYNSKSWLADITMPTSVKIATWLAEIEEIGNQIS